MTADTQSQHGTDVVMRANALTSVLARPILPPQISLPSFERLTRTVDRILDRFEAPTKKRETDALKLFQRLRDEIAQDRWTKVPMTFVTQVASLAFQPEFRERSDVTDLHEFILEEISASTKPGFLNPMARVYVESYVAGSDHTKALARALGDAAPKLGDQWKRILGEVPTLFDPDHAHKNIGAAMARMDNPWAELRAIGFRHPHAPGLLDAAHLAYLNEIEPTLTERSEIERLLGWLSPPSQQTRLSGAAEAVNALLKPWLNRNPPADIQQLLTDKLTEFYGHPRVSRQAAWNRVDTACEAVLLRWLMGADIRFLFRVLTEVERGHMWKEREDFWWSLYQQKRIDEVWIAFNREGHNAARRKMPKDAHAGFRRFALQDGDPDKSILIMRIGRNIVVEGTYNFKVHVFSADQANAPKLYQSHYSTGEIRGLPGAEKVMHLGDWQTKVRRLL